MGILFRVWFVITSSTDENKLQVKPDRQTKIHHSETKLGGSEPPITPIPGELTFLVSLGTNIHMCIHVCAHAQRH